MNLELSQNVSASLEGWYSDNLSWRWINWQYCGVLPVMFACVWYGIPREDIKTEMLEHLDLPGMAYAGLGFGLLYAGLDQGNRLDWNEQRARQWAARLRRLCDDSPSGTRVMGSRHAVSQFAASFSAPSHLADALDRGIEPLHHLVHELHHPKLPPDRAEFPRAAGWRGPALDRIPIRDRFAARLSSFARSIPRWVLAAGACLVGVASLMGSQLTSVWATDDFLQSQVLQALGQSFALTSLLALVVRSMNPVDALTIGTLLQTSRLFGGEIGTAFMETFVRHREQISLQPNRSPRRQPWKVNGRSIGGLSECRRRSHLGFGNGYSASNQFARVGGREAGVCSRIYRRLPRRNRRRSDLPLLRDAPTGNEIRPTRRPMTGNRG